MTSDESRLWRDEAFGGHAGHPSRVPRDGCPVEMKRRCLIRECISIVAEGIATAEGDLGAKTGKGFLTWTPEKANQVQQRRDQFLMQFFQRFYF